MGIGAAVASVVTGLLGTGAAALVVTYVATAALYVGAFVGLNALTRQNIGKPALGGRTVSGKSTNAPQAKIYGTALVASDALAFVDSLGPVNRELWSVHPLCGHEVNAITDVWLDDRVITNSIINGGAAAGGAVDSGTFGPINSGGTSVDVLEIYKHYGTASQTVNSALSTAAGSAWGTNHRLRGYAYLVTNFVLWAATEDLWEAGEPLSVKALVQGALIYDPRLDSTQIIDSTTSPVTMGSGAHRADDSSTWAYSNNPALCTADFLMDAKFSPFPGGISDTRIDWESVATAADDCEVLVFVPPAASPSNTEQRFTCNGVIYGSASGEQNLTDLLSSFNGDLIFTGGKYSIQAGVYVAPSDSLDEDDIVGPIKVASALDSQERINTVKASYIDKDMLYEPTETVAITKSAYKDDRDAGHELIATVELPLTDNWFEAQRICLKLLDAAHEELTLQVPCNLKAARLVPGQRVNLTLTERGWTPKVFIVRGWEIYDRGGDEIGVNVELREDQAAAYADPDVADYNIKTAAGTLVVADPDPIPGIDTIPRGIAYGEGTTSVIITADQNANGTANDGEIRFQAGRFVLPDGFERILLVDAVCWTPYESSTTPPDAIFYVVWGATALLTRFSSSPEHAWDSSQEQAGIFAAIYDRINDQWHAVDNANTEIPFTPAATDYVFARGTKTSASGGLDSLTRVVQQTEGREQGNIIPYQYADFEALDQLANHFTFTLGATGADLVLDTSLSFTGDQSLEITGHDGSAGGALTTVRFVPNRAGIISDEILRIRPNRRWMLSVAFYAQNTLGSTSNIRCELESAGPNVTGTLFTIGSVGAWVVKQIELDATAESRTSFNLAISLTPPTPTSPLTQGIINVDRVMLVDVTDFPEIVEEL